MFNEGKQPSDDHPAGAEQAQLEAGYNRKPHFGLARMHYEENERRDFLPDFVKYLQHNGAQVLLEDGYGSGMGYSHQDYLGPTNSIQFGPLEEVFRQDYVLVLRCPPDEQIRLMKPGACLISMLHFPTQPKRLELLRDLGLEAVSLDSLKDDTGRRLVENLRAVAWNGIEVAFEVLARTYPPPGFESINRYPVRVTVLGAGAVGIQVVRAAARYGNPALHRRLADQGIPGVQVTALEYDSTRHERVMRPILESTDILVDATQRPDPTRPVIPNQWVGWLPEHAVLLDLSVDPYDCTLDPPFMKGIEGIPQGNLDQYKFSPDDPAYDQMPACYDTTHRREAVSCYSWPGIYPNACMEVYGKQLMPIMRKILERGGVHNIQPNGHFFERAITRARLPR
jgi:alanine dehydrogenase